MREQIISTETGQTANIRPLTNAELNEVSGGGGTSDTWFFYSRSGTGGQLGLTQNITVGGYAPGIGWYANMPVFAKPCPDRR
jgi:hypothetical protein